MIEMQLQKKHLFPILFPDSTNLDKIWQYGAFLDFQGEVPRATPLTRKSLKFPILMNLNLLNFSLEQNLLPFLSFMIKTSFVLVSIYLQPQYGSQHCDSKVVFNQMWSSLKGCLPSKVVFHQRLSSIKGRLPSKFIFHWPRTRV